jgi:hypothetical protein
MSLYEGNTLLYSSKWTGATTALQILGGGNLKVQSGYSVNQGRGTEIIDPNPETIFTIIHKDVEDVKEIEEIKVESMTVKTYSNPTTSQFRLSVETPNKEGITIRVYDVNGVTLKTLKNVQPNQIITFGSEFRGGNYFAEVMQAGERKIVKLIKLN